jgi:hypothetical protein
MKKNKLNLEVGKLLTKEDMKKVQGGGWNCFWDCDNGGEGVGDSCPELDSDGCYEGGYLIECNCALIPD